jgi:hypothetical protein
MKHKSNTLLEGLTKKELNILTSEVKETIATFPKDKKRIFSAAQLWDIQRRKKNVFLKRNFF